MRELYLFVKATGEGYCCVSVFLENDKVYIHEAIISQSIDQVICDVKEMLSREQKGYTIGTIVFDGTYFSQEGFSLRESTRKDVIIYSNKKKFASRVLNQMDYIKENFVFRKTQTDTYASFASVYESFSNADKYNLAIDVLVDISKYIRLKK